MYNSVYSCACLCDVTRFLRAAAPVADSEGGGGVRVSLEPPFETKLFHFRVEIVEEKQVKLLGKISKSKPVPYSEILEFYSFITAFCFIHYQLRRCTLDTVENSLKQ